MIRQAQTRGNVWAIEYLPLKRDVNTVRREKQGRQGLYADASFDLCLEGIRKSNTSCQFVLYQDQSEILLLALFFPGRVAVTPVVQVGVMPKNSDCLLC